MAPPTFNDKMFRIYSGDQNPYSKCLYCSISTSSQHVYFGPNELVDKRVLVTLSHPLSQLKKMYFVEMKKKMFHSLPDLLIEHVFIFLCTDCYNFSLWILNR